MRYMDGYGVGADQLAGGLPRAVVRKSEGDREDRGAAGKEGHFAQSASRPPVFNSR
jgi:hypothetical protein